MFQVRIVSGVDAEEEVRDAQQREQQGGGLHCLFDLLDFYGYARPQLGHQNPDNIHQEDGVHQ